MSPVRAHEHRGDPFLASKLGLGVDPQTLVGTFQPFAASES
ncbi:hypothetical protein ACQP2Y_17080 [Actinoplanes sp. CA-051413]